MNNYVIIIKELYKTYNGIYAIDNLSLSVREKICFGLVGPNGAGKTTLINLLSGIIKADRGSVILLNEEMDIDNTKIKGKIGLLSQDLGLLNYLRCWEYLYFVARLYNVSKEQSENRINSLLRSLEIFKEKDRFLFEFSAGMQKKVAFIAAILHKPSIIFLDEPFESVDPISRKKMKDILKRMKEKGATILITSHALAEVEDFCDEVAIINKGKIVFQSETKDIRNKIKNEVTKETYQSLEEIFIDLTTDKNENDKMLSWL
ncbi:ABC transporter ATP-binding protein [Melioribacteraceae bacterium 4301-Me]|uniref:ABC transporter ATP-binding protein n=1 Tax=Pyranulibacter aquaticus TaxID=3163344 RepID=UPI003594A47B